MKLYERMGGLGRVELTEEENKALGELLDMFEKEGKLVPYAPGREGISLNDYSGPVSRNVRSIVSRLFPFTSEFTETFTAAYLEKAALNIGRGVYDNIHFGLKATSLKHYSYDSKVHIFKPSGDRGCSAVVTLSLASYQPDVVDDLATMLGKTYQMPLVGPLPIHSKHPDLNEKYGVADFPRFKEIQQLYERAAELINNQKWSVQENHPLNILRRDATEHPNLAVREESEHMYKRKLAELLLANP